MKEVSGKYVADKRKKIMIDKDHCSKEYIFKEIGAPKEFNIYEVSPKGKSYYEVSDMALLDEKTEMYLIWSEPPKVSDQEKKKRDLDHKNDINPPTKRRKIQKFVKTFPHNFIHTNFRSGTTTVHCTNCGIRAFGNGGVRVQCVPNRHVYIGINYVRATKLLTMYCKTCGKIVMK